MRYVAIVAGAIFVVSGNVAIAAGDATQGARVFRACAACHSLEANKSMTGPSLSGVWNRKAGDLPSFSRYSEAMKRSDVIWNDDTLDRYLKNPAQFMPGNHMTFPGIPDDKARADIVAFLKQSGTASAHDQSQPMQGGMDVAGGMGGMHRGPPKLKNAEASARVKSITYCRDTFTVVTQDGNSRRFWERNLRFKTDSSDDGPDKDHPAIVAAGMMGDRASVIFASPTEFSAFISEHC